MGGMVFPAGQTTCHDQWCEHCERTSAILQGAIPKGDSLISRRLRASRIEPSAGATEQHKDYS